MKNGKSHEFIVGTRKFQPLSDSKINFCRTKLMWALYIVHFEFWLYFMGPSVIGIKLKSALEAKVVCHINRVKTLILIPFRKRLFADRVSANKKLFANISVPIEKNTLREEVYYMAVYYIPLPSAYS